jgi:hypothetical protein
LVDVSKGLGNGASCATCLEQIFQDGSITFGIAVDDGPGIGFGIGFAGIAPLRCLVNSWAALSVLLKDAFPAELAQDAFVAAGNGLVTAVNGLNTFATTVKNSPFCDRTTDTIPSAPNSNTGIGPVDEVFNALAKLINVIGPNGAFGSLADATVSAICAANNTNDLVKFTNDVKEFLGAVSFVSIEDRIFKVIFDVISKMSEGINTFTTMEISIPNNCAPSDRACNLATEFGTDYLKCVQKHINDSTLGFGFEIGFGEHWLPPNIAGWGAGLSCANIDCYLCIMGLNSGAGSIKKITKLLVNEFVGSSGDENTRTTCPQVLTCAGGTWDTKACACRCSGGFLSTDAGCQKCPGPTTNVCNGQGACYNGDNGPVCCCAGGKTTPDCS